MPLTNVPRVPEEHTQVGGLISHTQVGGLIFHTHSVVNTGWLNYMQLIDIGFNYYILSPCGGRGWGCYNIPVCSSELLLSLN